MLRLVSRTASFGLVRQCKQQPRCVRTFLKNCQWAVVTVTSWSAETTRRTHRDYTLTSCAPEISCSCGAASPSRLKQYMGIHQLSSATESCRHCRSMGPNALCKTRGSRGSNSNHAAKGLPNRRWHAARPSSTAAPSQCSAAANVAAHVRRSSNQAPC
jgi:hypothetical protein